MTSCSVTLEGDRGLTHSCLRSSRWAGSFLPPISLVCSAPFLFPGCLGLVVCAGRGKRGWGGGAWGRRADRPPTVSQVVTHLLLSHLCDLPSCSISFLYFHVPHSAVFTTLSQGFPAQTALSRKETEIAQCTSVSFPAHKICALAFLALPTCLSLPRNSQLSTSRPHSFPFPVLPSHPLPRSLARPKSLSV